MPSFALSACAVGESSGLLAMRAKHADEALRQHGFERRGDQIRFDAHVHQPRDRAGRVVGVQRGENQMAGERRLHGDLRRFLVANFADENHVRVVAQNRTQSARKRQPGLFVDLDLVDALELVFHRVFNRDDFADGIVDFVERGVKRGGFAAAGRAGDEDDAVRQLRGRAGNSPVRACPCPVRARPRSVAFCRSKRITTASPCSIGMTETRMSTSASSMRTLMRPSCGRRFSAMLRWLKILTRETMAGWKRFSCAGTGTVLQHAVNAVADAEFVLERFQVDVRRAQFDGVLQHLVDEADDGRLVLGGVVEVGVLGVFVNDLESPFPRRACRWCRRRRRGVF